MTEEEIIAFARQWNPEPFHIDKQAALDHPVGRLFASGVHLLSICIKLANEIASRDDFVASLGWDDIRFLKPVFPGDTVWLEHGCIDKRRSKSQPEKAVITFALKLFNQHNELNVSLKIAAMIRCR